MELGYTPALKLESGTTLVLGCKRYLKCSPVLELGHERTPLHGKHFKPEVGVKITRH